MKDADSLTIADTSADYHYTSQALQSWQNSFDFVDQFNSGALSNISGYTAHYTDWRVPNVNEMESFLKADSPQYTWLNQAGFVNFRRTPLLHVHHSRGRYYVSMGRKHDLRDDLLCFEGYLVHVEPVRGISNGPAKVWQTGQTKSYNPGDDGDNAIHGYGTAWDHSTRFIDNTDTVTDTLTGFMWAKSVTGSPG